MADNGPMTIRLNNGDVVTRPYREAVRLLSRRMADAVDPDATDADLVPLDADAGTGLDDLTKAELVDMARERGLSTSGNKPELIERLSHPDADAAGVATPENVPEETKASTSDGRD